MLRPATPLSILFFIAFVLLLLSTLSTPIIKAVPLGTFEGINFGVFGYCDRDKCSGLKLGYGTSTCELFADKDELSCHYREHPHNLPICRHGNAR